MSRRVKVSEVIVGKNVTAFSEMGVLIFRGVEVLALGETSG